MSRCTRFDAFYASSSGASHTLGLAHSTRNSLNTFPVLSFFTALFHFLFLRSLLKHSLKLLQTKIEMILAVDAVGPSYSFDDIKCIWLNFLVILRCF
jgi:hypothetical protein